MPAVGDLVEVGLRELFRQLAEFVFDSGDGRNRIDLYALDALGGENLVRGVGIDDARNQDVGKSREGLPERCHVSRFGAVVELVDQRSLQLLHDTYQIDARPRRRMVGEKTRQLAEEL